MATKIYDIYGFTARLQFLTRAINDGREPTRNFDTCMEMGDGDYIAAALYRKAQKSKDFLDRMQGYFCLESVQSTAEKLADLTDQQLRTKAYDVMATETLQSIERIKEMDARGKTDNRRWIRMRQAELKNRPAR